MTERELTVEMYWVSREEKCSLEELSNIYNLPEEKIEDLLTDFHKEMFSPISTRKAVGEYYKNK